MGKPGFPIPLPRGRVAEGNALPAPLLPVVGRGMGKPGFPTPLPRGRVWEGVALPGNFFFTPGV